MTPPHLNSSSPVFNEICQHSAMCIVLLSKCMFPGNSAGGIQMNTE